MSAPAQKFKWWWRDREKAKSGSKVLRRWLNSPLHERETLRAAWYYEAEKRLTGKYRFEKPFPRLTSRQMREAVNIWGRHEAERNAIGSAMISCDPGVMPFDHGHWYWPRVSVNLKASNDAIFRALAGHLDEVRAKRQEREIEPAKRGRKPGVNPHRDEAWKQIEAYDEGTGIGEIDRKQKSEMRTKYFENTLPRYLPDGEAMVEMSRKYFKERRLI